MLIDEFLPEYDFVETHSIVIDASAANVYAAANEVDFSDSFIVRWLLRLRGMSGSVLERREIARRAVHGFILTKKLILAF